MIPELSLQGVIRGVTGCANELQSDDDVDADRNEEMRVQMKRLLMSLQKV